MSKKWHTLSTTQIENKLKTNAATGLSRKAARSRSAKSDGGLYYVQKKSIFKMLLEVLSDFAWVLMLLTAISFLFFDEIKTGAVVLFFALSIIAFMVFIYHRCVRTSESVDAFFRPQAKVIREGKLYRIDYSRVVVGDVILLEKGDVVLSDARLVRSDAFSVEMKISKDEQRILSKNAGAVVGEKEYNVFNMDNMVHAGSTVTGGSARAIVTDIGRYTYIGALKGSFQRKIDERVPSELSKAKKLFSNVSMILLVGILPVCIIGLLMSNLRGGKVYLSHAFLLSVTLAASLLVQRVCTVFRYFYIYFLRRSVANKNPVVIKNASVFEILSDIDYIFLLDGAALSEGAYHFSEVVGVDTFSDAQDRYLSELVYLYRNIESKAISAGVSASEPYYRGIDEYLEKRTVDVSKLNIKYSVLAYSVLSENGEKCESIALTSNGDRLFIKVYRTPRIISKCAGYIADNDVKQISEKEACDIEAYCMSRLLEGNRLLIFTVTKGDGEREYFAGAICFGENKDPKALRCAQILEKNCAKIIAFADNASDIDQPSIPNEFHRAPCVRACDFEEKALPITYKFGNFSTYLGMSADQIAELISCAHSIGKTVMVVGISEFAESVADNADVFVTFSPIASTLSGYLDEEIKILDTNGASTGASCEQKTKGKADMMITRPTAEKGGLNTLLRSFGFSQWARQNMNGFARFSVAMLVLRIFIMIVPMLLGNIMLDARHLLFFMTFFDIPVFLTYALNTNIKQTNEIFIKDKLSFKEYIIKERNLLIAMGISAVLLYLLPHIPDVLGMKYFYSTEYYFVASIWLHFFAWYFIYYRKANKAMIKELLKNRIMLVAFAVILIITVALFIIEPFGLVLGLDRNPIVFLLVGFVPPIAFAVAFILLGKRKTAKKDKIVNNL